MEKSGVKCIDKEKIVLLNKRNITIYSFTSAFTHLPLFVHQGVCVYIYIYIYIYIYDTHTILSKFSFLHTHICMFLWVYKRKYL